jgi:hypothetical protein
LLRYATRFISFEDNTHLSAQSTRDPAEHAERMAFVPRRFEPADLLLSGLEFASEVRLRKAGLFAQRGELQGNIPRFARSLEALRETWVAELFV